MVEAADSKTKILVVEDEATVSQITPFQTNTNSPFIYGFIVP